MNEARLTWYVVIFKSGVDMANDRDRQGNKG